MIKLEHVSKSYSAGIPALNDVSLNIEEGEFVFIVGDSGSGKRALALVKAGQRFCGELIFQWKRENSAFFLGLPVLENLR